MGIPNGSGGRCGFCGHIYKGDHECSLRTMSTKLDRIEYKLDKLLNQERVIRVKNETDKNVTIEMPKLETISLEDNIGWGE